MTISARWPSACAPRYADDEQALLLAGTLRASRLTVLYGGAGVGKTALLTAGVLPLLDRRRIAPPDQPEQTPHTTIKPFPPVGQSAGATLRGGLLQELGLFFDAWEAPPWPGLQAAVRHALSMPSAAAPSQLGMAQTLAAWTEPRGARLLVILDRFDECLAGAAQRPDLRAFADDLVQSVNRQDLQVNFLVALRDDAEPLMARLCRRIPGFDPHRLELAPAGAGAAPASRARHALHAASRAQPGAGANPSAGPCKPVFSRLGRTPTEDRGRGERSPPRRSEQAAAGRSPGTGEVYAAIDAMLARTASSDTGVLPMRLAAADAREPWLPDDDARPAVSRERLAGGAWPFANSARPTAGAAAAAAAYITPSPLAQTAGSAAHGSPLATEPATPVNERATPVTEPATPVTELATSVTESAASVAQPAAPVAEPVTPIAEVSPPAAQAVAAAAQAAPAAQTDVASAPRPEARRWLQWLAAPAALAGILFFVQPPREEDRAPGPEVAGWPAAAPVAEPAAPAEPRPPAPLAPLADGSRAVPLEPATPPAPPVFAAPAMPPAAQGRRLAAPQRPRLEITTDVGAVSDRRLAGELSRAMTPAAGIEVGVLPSVHWATSLAGPGGAARLAIVRYDALQAARGVPGPLALEIVAPLHTDAISFLVADDSPLRFIHEIEGRRIHVGPAQSAGGLTAASVYRRLFGKPLAPSGAQETQPQAALRQLLVERSIDVMVVVGAPPAALLADQAESGPRLLALDPDHPASRRALQTFLPAATRWPNGRTAAADTPTLGVMSFLVGTAASSPAEAERLTAFARELCRALPVLQREGDPKWRTVQPALRIEVGWPYSEAAAAGFDACSNTDTDTESEPGRGERPKPAARTGHSLPTRPRRPA